MLRVTAVAEVARPGYTVLAGELLASARPSLSLSLEESYSSDTTGGRTTTTACG